MIGEFTLLPGLSTILFAISIDRPEMNNVVGSVASPAAEDEQVIQEPSPFTGL